MSNPLRRAGYPRGVPARKRGSRGWAWWPCSAIAWSTALLIGTLLVVQAAQAAPVPDFTLPLLDGTTTSLQNHRGAPVLINFFHSK